jgi:hypothetical protein
MHQMSEKKLYILSTLLFLFSACAQIGSLTGGEKDKEPPVLVKSTPAEKSLNYSGDQVILGFNEFIQLNNINSVFFSSPPLIEKPDFNLKRKNLVIDLNNTLYDTTTYTFWFGDAIQDFHESNPLKNFKFVFSTGNVLDTFEISGKLMDAVTLKGEADFFVMLYRNFEDSAPLVQKPFYAVKSDSAGLFKIDYIKPGKYKLFALKDNDADFLYNLPNEKIAFIDSFLFPKVETRTIIDSLKAGSVIHVGDSTTTGDTLKRDTVIIHDKYIYSPNNLKLFTFTEDRQKQYIINKSREQAGRCTFEFFKPTDSVFVEGLNFKYLPEEMYIEKSDSSKKLICWIKNATVYGKDTLKFIISYYEKDSLEHFYKVRDTIPLIFNHQSDTLKRFAEFEVFKTDQDSSNYFGVELKTPFQSFNQENIKLYELFDTLVEDPRIQSVLKAYRPEPDVLYFTLNRPHENIFYIEPLNIDTTSGWGIQNRFESKTVLEYRLTNKETTEKDTIKAVLHYDNVFFKGQIQTFSDTLEFPLFKQDLQQIKRPEEDLIILTFKKKVSPETTIEFAENNNQLEYEIIDQPVEEELHFKLRTTDLIQKDTLLIKIRTKDFDNTKGDRIFYEYDKQAVFIHKKQKLNTFKRTKKDEFTLIFNKPVAESPVLSLIDYKPGGKWYIETINTKRDTLQYVITETFLTAQDTIRIALSMGNEIKSDTLKLIYKTPNRHQPGIKRNQQKKTITGLAPGKQKVTLETPVEYYILEDSVSKRTIYIGYPWKAGKEYVVRFDTSAFTDIYLNKSNQTETKFKIRTKDFYGKMTLNITNIKRISDKDFYLKKDSAVYDSLQYSLLENGQLIIYLLDKDNKVILERTTQQDGKLIFENLIPGEYTLKIIYDQNSNRTWDTGNYLKNIQPERVLIYPQKISIKSATDQNTGIKILTPE